VAIMGEISNIEAKELKSGNTLISFALYDGSSSMTCKAFIKRVKMVRYYPGSKRPRV
jgi:DNA polymerase-3 subunit alpha (Gram-positive type)